jgi:signal transduction histidine kinase
VRRPRLTARRRVVLATILGLPVGYWYVSWALQLGRNLYRTYFHTFGDSYVSCSGTWRDWAYGCDQGPVNTAMAWLEFALVTLVLLGLCFAAARWALVPLRPLSRVVDQLGPTNLGSRIAASGPRDESRQLADSVDAMLDRISEGYEAQRRFAADASHELRTPLATQRALIEISLVNSLSPDQLALLSRQLLATNERNEALIEALLVLAETDRGLMSRTPQRLDAIVAEVLDTLGPLADEATVTLGRRLVPVTVPGERPLLERLVSNLVHNAIKYNVPDGRVDVSLAAPARLVVTNTGPLVPPMMVSTLFEPFRRMSGDRLNHGGGAGLGLTIARSIVAAHRGWIEAHAQVDGGLSCTVDLAPGE